MRKQTSPFTYLNSHYADDRNGFGPRVQFNHGFHDATFDQERGCPRELTADLHDTRHVAPTWDRMYFEGYKAGLTTYLSQGRPQSSEPAWVAFRDSLTDDQLKEVFQAEVIAYQATWPRKQRNEWILKEAQKQAGLVCGVMS